MRTGAGVAAVAGLGLDLVAGTAGLGFAIAKRPTAPPPGRVYNLAVRGIVQHEGHDAVVLDRNASTVATGVYNLWLEDGGWVRFGPVVGEDAATVTRLVVSAEPEDALRVGQRASWSGIYYSDPEDAGLESEDAVVETPGRGCASLAYPPDRERDDRPGDSHPWACESPRGHAPRREGRG